MKRFTFYIDMFLKDSTPPQIDMFSCDIQNSAKTCFHFVNIYFKKTFLNLNRAKVLTRNQAAYQISNSQVNLFEMLTQSDSYL